MDLSPTGPVPILLNVLFELVSIVTLFFGARNLCKIFKHMRFRPQLYIFGLCGIVDQWYLILWSPSVESIVDSSRLFGSRSFSSDSYFEGVRLLAHIALLIMCIRDTRTDHANQKSSECSRRCRWLLTAAILMVPFFILAAPSFAVYLEGAHHRTHVFFACLQILRATICLFLNGAAAMIVVLAVFLAILSGRKRNQCKVRKDLNMAAFAGGMVVFVHRLFLLLYSSGMIHPHLRFNAFLVTSIQSQIILTNAFAIWCMVFFTEEAIECDTPIAVGLPIVANSHHHSENCEKVKLHEDFCNT